MPIQTSGTSKWTRSRDDIITRALRTTGELGTGEAASSTRITEVAGVLNDLCQAWNADGMPLWKVTTSSGITYTATNSYPIGVGQVNNQVAPLKIVQAWNRDTSVTPNTDAPVIVIPKMDYDILSAKTSTGRPNQIWYLPPGPGTGAAGATSDLVGTITTFVQPDTVSQANLKLFFVGQYAFQDFVSSTDVPDFPPYWYNALAWGLAAQICYESGTPYAERSMIKKMADEEKYNALGYGTEEGSLLIQPRQQYGSMDRA